MNHPLVVFFYVRQVTEKMDLNKHKTTFFTTQKLTITAGPVFAVPAAVPFLQLESRKLNNA